MKALAFYLVYPFIRILAALPFSVLYFVSDGMARLLILSGYRREVVEMNLRNSFPEKSTEEIKQLSRSYYHYLCDLILETLKTMTMSEEEYRKRITLNNPEVLSTLASQDKSIVLLLGHFGNWEWFGPCVTLKTNYQLVVIYRPLSDPYFERMASSWRTRFGTEITPVQQTLRAMVANKNRLTATAFVADQAAPANAYWTTFLNQDTSVFTGAEKIATKFDYPVVYLHAARPKRGYYTITPEVLFEHPSQTAENQISEAFTRRLEKDIIANPVIWLWSHKRWKNKRSPPRRFAYICARKPEPVRTEKELLAASKEFVGENKTRSWYEFLITLVLIAGMLTVCFMKEIPLAARVASSVICGLLYVRLFVIYHDYRHRAILLNSPTASLLMKIVGLYVLAPENIWTRSHEHHHNNNSKLTMSGIGSYPTVSKERFLTLSNAQRRLYLVNRHPLTIIFGYFTLFIYWLNLKSFIESPKKHMDSLLALVAHVAIAAVIWITLGFEVYVLTWFLPIFIMSGLGAYLFYCQHNFPGATFKENKDWTYANAALASTSYMVMSPVMHWFTANIGFHHVHHINSRIPFYRLKEAMEKMPELHNAKTTSWNPVEVWRCFRLKAWDEESGKMITMRQLKASALQVKA